jgi:hypothetical protein
MLPVWSTGDDMQTKETMRAERRVASSPLGVLSYQEQTGAVRAQEGVRTRERGNEPDDVGM